MVKFIDDEKEKYGVEPICRILPIAPSTYYRIKDEQDNPEKQCRRKQSDKHLMAQIKQIWQAQVYLPPDSQPLHSYAFP